MKVLLRNVTAPCRFSMHPSNWAYSYMNTLKGSAIKLFAQSNRKSQFTGEKVGSNFIKSQNMLMMLCRWKVTKQSKICRFLTTLIQKSAFAIFSHYENFFSSRNWYHNATAPISTVLFTLCPMSWRNVIELIQNWDNQNQQAKSFRIRYNLSKLNNRNYQTLIWCLAIIFIMKYEWITNWVEQSSYVNLRVISTPGPL